MSKLPAYCDGGHVPAITHAPFTLGRRASFWVSAGVVAHTLWTSAAPAMTYRLYAAEWHLNPTITTSIFAIYPIVVVAVLIAFGDLSDHIGRRATMLLGLSASLLGALTFALAPDVAWLLLGRALMGAGVGLSAPPSTAAMMEFAPANQPALATSMTAAAQATGLATALLLSGALIEYAPFPTRLSFWALSAALLALLAATWFLPNRPAITAATRWRLKTPSVPPELRATFTVAAVAITTAYTHGALVLSLGGQVAHDLIGSANALANSATLASFAILFGTVGIIARPLRPRLAIALGAIASATGMALLAASVAQHALWIFLAATTTSGAGYSLLFLGGLQMLNIATTARYRAGTLSALYLLAYLSMGLVALLLGFVATARGLAYAVNLGAAAIALLSAASLILALTRDFTSTPG